MNDQKPKGTFAKLMSSTPPPPLKEYQEKHGSSENEKVDQLNASKPVYQNAGIPENQQASIPEVQNAGKPANKPLMIATEKVTFRFHPQGKYALEDIKTILTRQLGTKASFELIAEEAILIAYEDLLENQNASKLAIRLSGKPENKKSR
jgi:hypothetical protein